MCGVIACEVIVCGVIVWEVIVCGVIVCEVIVCGVIVCDVIVCGVIVCDVIVCGVIVCDVQSQICKEFVVPSAEANGDHFNSELVCFYPAPPPVQTTPFPRHIGLVAVSSSGTAYSWSNVLQHDKAKGYADKQIVERGVAHSLHCIPVSIHVVVV